LARFDVSDGTLWLQLSLLERFGASVRQDFGVLLNTVRSVRVTEDVWAELRGVRAPGTAVRGVIALGTRRHPLGRDFVAVYGKGPAVVVDLTGVHFLRLVVSTADAAEVADEIETAATEVRFGL
jgi:hypothetical protein